MPKPKLSPGERLLATLAYVFLGVPGAILLCGAALVLLGAGFFYCFEDDRSDFSADEAIMLGIAAACFAIGYLMCSCASIVGKEPQYRIDSGRLVALLGLDLLQLLLAIATTAAAIVALLNAEYDTPGKATRTLIFAMMVLALGSGTFLAIRKRKQLFCKWKAGMVELPPPWPGTDSLPGQNPR